MNVDNRQLSRRRLLSSAVASAMLTGLECAADGLARPEKGPADLSARALIAVTLDLEMAMHYPKWGMTEWNYEKGNLTEPVKQYAREACRRVKAKGGVAQCFVVGRVFEQASVEWLKEIVREGHAVGNHTYDHVNVWATRPEELQYRFARAPWLIRGKTVPEVIRENIRLTDAAMQARLGVRPIGFRTPGGSPNGLRGRPDLQKLLLQCGFTWVSSMAASVPVKPENPDKADFDAIVKAQAGSQPFVYPSGLVEIPMSPLGDVASFRRKEKKWRLGDFLRMIEADVRWAIEHRAVFDLLTHPSIMLCEDPEFRAYELVGDLAQQSPGRAAIVGLDTIAKLIRSA
jgi:peptidoglycan/xylan/chitin deacetylase (PgdA/CDA1 family)